MKNIIFDIGNVMVRWSPELIIQNTFSTLNETDLNNIFKDPTWIQLNLGQITELEAIQVYRKKYGYKLDVMQRLFSEIKTTQALNEGTLEILQACHENQYQLFALSDNVNEIVTYLKERYDFWKYFKDIIISAEVGLIKPNHDIFLHLIDKHELMPEETVFIDDLPHNVEAACQLRISGIQFENAVQCRQALRDLGVQI